MYVPGVIRLDLVTFGGLRLTGRSPRVHSLIVHKTFSTPNPVLSCVHSLLCQQPSSVCYQGLITLEERHHHRGRFALATERGTFGSQFQIPIAVGLELAGRASVRFLAVSPSSYRRGKHCSRGGDVAQDALFPRPRWSWASRLGLARTQHTTLLHPHEVIFELLGHQRCVLGSSHPITNGIGAIV